jgi:hypothetical protein
MSESEAAPRPAFYALRSGGWRDYLTLIHPPYTAWHLSYVVIGAALAPDFRTGRLAWTLAAFFLALGIGAHALDELRGRPLQTRIPAPVLLVLAVCTIAGASAIGVWAAFAWTPWLLLFVAFGAFIVVVYNLELFGGRFHTAFWFAASWGAFPAVTAVFASAERVTWAAVAAGAFAALTTAVQRQLSIPVRTVRRRVRHVEGTVELADGTLQPVTREMLMGAPERALQTIAAALVVLAIALVLFRVA